jgi:hypothetical protein
MAAFADLSELVNRATGGNNGNPECLFPWKDSRVAGAAAVSTVAGRLTSLWQYDGQPAGGSAPGAVAAPTRATAGAIGQANPGGGRQKWLTYACALSNQGGALQLYDRLLHISSLSGTVATAQTVGGALTRSTGGAGNEIWVEIYSQIGSSAVGVTASYTNQAGTSGRTTQATAIGSTGFREAQRVIKLPLQAGDTGVQAVASVTLAGTTGTAGDFGITIARPIALVPTPSISVAGQVTALDGLPVEIPTDACLAWLWYPLSTGSPQVHAQLSMVER